MYGAGFKDACTSKICKTIRTVIWTFYRHCEKDTESDGLQDVGC